MTCSRPELLLASQTAVGDSHRVLASLRTEIVCPAKSGDFLLQTQQFMICSTLEGMFWGICDQVKHVGLWSVYAMALWCIMPIVKEVLQGSVNVHQLVCNGMLRGLGMDPGLSTLYGKEVP